VRCETYRARGGGVVAICRSGKRKNPPCYRDGGEAAVQCDFPVGKRDAGVAIVVVTCDRWCCDNGACAVQIGPNKHYCRWHFDQAGKPAINPTERGGVA
jgi:hypothetical protein